MPLEADQFRSDPRKPRPARCGRCVLPRRVDGVAHGQPARRLPSPSVLLPDLAGMPVSDDGKQVVRLGLPITWRSKFPLATVWDTLSRAPTSAASGTHSPAATRKSTVARGTSRVGHARKGSIVSSPATIEVRQAGRRQKRFSCRNACGSCRTCKIGLQPGGRRKGRGDTPQRLLCRHDDLHGGWREGSSLQSGTPKPDADNPVAQLLDYHGGDKRLSYTIVVFETADQVEHGCILLPARRLPRTVEAEHRTVAFREATPGIGAGQGKPVGLRLTGRAEISGQELSVRDRHGGF